MRLTLKRVSGGSWCESVVESWTLRKNGKRNGQRRVRMYSQRRAEGEEEDQD